MNKKNKLNEKRENKKNNHKIIQAAVTGLMVILLALTVFQAFQISTLYSEVSELKATGLVSASALSNTGTETESGTTNTSKTTSEKATLQQILKEITPTGTPDYGKETGVSYEEVESGLKTLVGFHQTVSLSEDEKQRYASIATTKETACEFCCGIGEAGFGTSDGRIACGCSHNVAFSGLTKWLIKNSDYSDQQIVNEIRNWKVLFFPRGAVQKELEKRNIEPESVGLPGMVGGC